MKIGSKIISSLACAGILAFSATASAKLITVSESGGWTGTDQPLIDSFSGTPANNGPTTVPVGVLGTTAEWFPASDPKSGLIIEFFSETKNVPTGGSATYTTARLTQINSVLLQADGPSPYVHTLDFAADFLISDPDNGDAALFTDSPTGSVTHTETINESPCDAFPNPAGTVCNDLYTFVLNLSPPVPFEIDGEEYEFSFDFVFSDDIVFQDNVFYTPEGQDNFIDLVVTIRSLAEVSEPATLALFGLGIMGIGFAARRKTKKA